MKYPWTGLTILGIWVISTLIVGSQKESIPEVIFFIAMISTIIIAFFGFRS